MPNPFWSSPAIKNGSEPPVRDPFKGLVLVGQGDGITALEGTFAGLATQLRKRLSSLAEQLLPN
eukprot:11170551-Lingulodinium_polyedra.AAC.1